MRRTQLPITALPAWCKLNDVSFIDTAVSEIGEKGFGLITECGLSSQDTFDTPTLLLIPEDLILSAETIEEYGKVDHHFKQLLDVAGGKSLRGDILLFLIMQITIASPENGQNVGISNPWTEYIKILPSTVPVPTMWTEREREMLIGTSLEFALSAKLAALNREFESLQESTSAIPWCQKCWWENECLEIEDWLLVDALYRSRCLELPVSGESMVPALDMANHSSTPTAYYEQLDNKSVALLLKPDMRLISSSEITISYGDSKSIAEMLFSYGFIDERSASKTIVLSLEPFPDDPLGKAKVAAFSGPLIVRIVELEGKIEWESSFLYLMCLNEEDGLDFKVLQQTDGSRSHLKMFWQGSDITEKSTMMETLISNHELKEVFRLRALVLLQDRIRQQLERLYESEDALHSLAGTQLAPLPRQLVAIQLRTAETATLETAFASIDMQKNKLLGDESVVRYLGSMDDIHQEEAETNDDEEDFS